MEDNQIRSLQATGDSDESIKKAINELLVLVATAFILLMQLGFALLESGLARRKNSKNILIKNVFDACIGVICFWLIGFGVAFHDQIGSFIGLNGAMLASNDFDSSEKNLYLMWIFQFSFAATSSTIVSGSLAERTQLNAYIAYSCLMTTLIYPVVVGWCWGGGWLGDTNPEGMGFHDFAGSGIVHLVGGVAGFAGAYMVGPRHGKEKNEEDRKNVFDEPETIDWLQKQGNSPEVEWYVNQLQKDQDFQINSFPFVVFGTILMTVGWLFFNAGSTMSMFQAANPINSSSKIMMITLLSSSTGGLISAFLRPLIMGTYSQSQRYDVGALCNGMLAGAVSITGVCDQCEPWSACLVGLIGSLIYCFSCKLWQRLNVDDPIEASQVHGGCGLWGLIAVGIFDGKKGLISDAPDSMKYFGVQLIGAICIIVWVMILSLSFFWILKKLKLLRVPLIDEILGLDLAQMGSQAAVDNVVAQAIYKAQRHAVRLQQVQSETKKETMDRTPVYYHTGSVVEQSNRQPEESMESMVNIAKINLEIESERITLNNKQSIVNPV